MPSRVSYARLDKGDSHDVDFSNGRNQGWFSRSISWLVEHPWILCISLLMCLLLLSIAGDQLLASAHAGVPKAHAAVQKAETPPSADADKDPRVPETTQADKPVFSKLFGAAPEQADETATWIGGVKSLSLRLALSALLGAIVAFRPRRSIRNRNPYVVQTQILLAVVACALMMIVGDSAARAFGIFAAASLVRFRTNIRDPKETTVLLINLGIGLAAGVGRWELATGFAFFVLLLLTILETYEESVGALELSVKSHDVGATDEAVRQMFRRNNLGADVQEFNKESEKHPLGKVVYCVSASPDLDTDRLAEQIYEADTINIDKVEWHRKKAHSYA